MYPLRSWIDKLWISISQVNVTMDHRALLSSSSAAASAFTLLDDANPTSVNEFIDSLREYGGYYSYRLTCLRDYFQVQVWSLIELNFTEKEPWVVENLITHYLKTESQRAAELVSATHSIHDKVSINEVSYSRTCIMTLTLYIPGHIQAAPFSVWREVDQKRVTEVTATYCE